MNSTTARPLNVSYLVMGLVFLVVAGVLGLVAFATRGVRSRRSGDHAEPYDTDTYDTNDAETR